MSKLFAFVDSLRGAFGYRSPLARKSHNKRSRPLAVSLRVEQFDPRKLIDGNAYMMAVMNLVPDAAVTDTAVQNGAWSNPSTWQSGQLPANNANVLIPMGLSVTVDNLVAARLHTIRVDGTLQF